MKYILLASFVALVAGKSLLGEKKCTYGPAYWCQNMETAKECGPGAISHCVMKEWRNGPEGTLCDACKYAVTVIHTVLENNATEQEIIASLKEVCSLMGSMASECNSLIDSYGQEIIELIAQYTTDPVQVCNLLGLCTSKAVPLIKLSQPAEISISRHVLMPGPVVAEKIVEKKPVNKVDASTQCVLCEFVMSKLDSLISKTSTQEEIEDALDKVCSFLPGTISTECQEFINTFTPAILNLLSQYMNPKAVCTMLKLCTATPLKVVKPKPVTSGAMCQICEFAVGWIDQQLKNNVTETEILNTLEGLCSYIPNVAIANECKALIGEYGRQILALLAAELDPNQICKEIGLCTGQLLSEMKLVKSGTVCSLCEMVVGYVDQLLKNNATQEEITNVLNTLCSYLPSSMSTTCSTLVKEYVPYIIELLEAQSPQEVCSLLGLCQAQSTRKVLKVEQRIVTHKRVKAGPLCEVCEMAVGYLDNILKQNATEAEIKQALDTVCSFLPSSLSSECEQLINEYADEIIQLLVSELSPSLVCKELGLCAASTKTFLGRKRCTQGPMYWCSSVAAAKACGAYEHCKARKWKV